MIPLIEREVVERKGWISKEEFLNLMAIAQSAREFLPLTYPYS